MRWLADELANKKIDNLRSIPEDVQIYVCAAVQRLHRHGPDGVTDDELEVLEALGYVTTESGPFCCPYPDEPNLQTWRG